METKALLDFKVSRICIWKWFNILSIAKEIGLNILLEVKFTQLMFRYYNMI